MDSSARVAHTTAIVVAFVGRHYISPMEIPDLMRSIHDTLGSLGQPVVSIEPEVEKPTPAAIRKSITPDGLVSFIDGKLYKTLKRHLTKHGLNPHSYRERYGLPTDYPTTSANYSAQRSALAKSLGLGAPGGPQALKTAA